MRPSQSGANGGPARRPKKFSPRKQSVQAAATSPPPPCCPGGITPLDQGV